MQKLIDALRKHHVPVRADASMSEYTTFKTGGKADLLSEPQSQEQLLFALKLFSEASVPYLILGNGSNILVTDEGYRGAVIRIGRHFSSVSIERGDVLAGAGGRLSTLVNKALASGLTGLEFAGGIPGTVGGAIYMNAGAYGGEIADFLMGVVVLNENYQVLELSATSLDLDYRHSVFMEKPYVILAGKFTLPHGDAAAARQKLKQLNAERKAKQPLEYPSAGSTFKRPVSGYAASFIEQAGLKGYSIGGAQVSEKHAGFIINKGNATSKELLSLIADVRKRVYEMSGVLLQPEIRIVGEGAEQYV